MPEPEPGVVEITGELQLAHLEPCVHLGGSVRRLVASATSRPKGGDMRHSHRQIGQRVHAAREPAIICHVYGKRG